MNGALLRAALLVLCTLLSGACADPVPGDEALTFGNDDERILYAMGAAMARNNPSLAVLEMTPREANMMQQGLMDVALEREPQVDVAEFERKFQPMLQRRAEELAKRERSAAEAFLAEAEAAEGAVRLPSGTVLKRIESGEGTPISEIPMSALLKLRIEGWRRDGKRFAQMAEDQPPHVVRMNKLLPCWRDGLQQASIGGKFEVTCPPDTAYGDKGMIPRVKPGAAIAFRIEVVDVIEREASSAAPSSDPSDS